MGKMFDISDCHAISLLVVIFSAITIFVLGFTQGWFNNPGFSAEVINRAETWNSHGTPQYFITVQMIEKKQDIEVTVNEFFSGQFKVGKMFISPDSYNWNLITGLSFLFCILYLVVFFVGGMVWPKHFIGGGTKIQYGYSEGDK